MPDDRLPAPIRADIARLPASGIHQVFMAGYGRPGLIALWVGEGDQPTPDFIGQAATAALRAGKTFYNPKRGIPELRQALATYMSGLHGQPVGPERVSVTSSGMTGLVTVIQTLVAPGDNVIVVTPVWPNIMAAIEIASGQVKPVELDARPEGGFSLDLGKLEAAIDGRTRAIFCASPGNPTGWMATAGEQAAILELCRRKRIWLIADEVYVRFVYGPGQRTAPSYLDIARPDDPLLVCNSFSKAWAMTGWRLGWITHPAALGETFETLTEFTTSGAPHFLQYGAVAALQQGEAFVAALVERCRQSGEIVYQALAGLPRVRLARPEAAFYAFFKLEGMRDSLAEALRILEAANVGLAPGSAFGPGGEGHLRLCFAASPARLAEAMERLRPALA
jgi:aspartate aminotransferase